MKKGTTPVGSALSAQDRTTAAGAASGTGTKKQMPEKEEPKPSKDRDDALDEALEETFPASDPISIQPEKPEKAEKPSR